MTNPTEAAFPETKAPVRIPKAIVAATVAGNALEFFDFACYAYFAVYIGRTFFPVANPLISLLLSVAVFGVGFVTRPLGGIAIGALADRKGRKPAMLLTITLITVGTLGLAVTPSYASIGMAAPIIVVITRLVQGFALGGEVGPATAFLMEIAPPHQRGMYTSFQLASQGLSATTSGILGFTLTRLLSPAQMQGWGWRLPFVFGILLLPVALYLRKHMPETLLAAQGKRSADRVSARVLWTHRRLIVLGILVIMSTTVTTYTSMYMTSYAITTLKLRAYVAMAGTIVLGVATALFSFLGGCASDRWGRKPIMLWPRVAAVVLTVPAFLWLISSPSLLHLAAVVTLLAAVTASSGTAVLTSIPEQFPNYIRATGVSLVYALGVSIFGSTTQPLVTWLIHRTGSAIVPAWYVVAINSLSAVAVLLLVESRHVPVSAAAPKAGADGTLPLAVAPDPTEP